MFGKVGDRLIIKGTYVSRPVRRGLIVHVGRNGHPPYTVKWEGTESETMIYPGSDAVIERQEAIDPGLIESMS